MSADSGHPIETTNEASDTVPAVEEPGLEETLMPAPMPGIPADVNTAKITPPSAEEAEHLTEPITPFPEPEMGQTVELSPRMLRVLRTLERRGMRNVRLKKRVPVKDRWLESEEIDEHEQATIQISLTPMRPLQKNTDTPVPDPITPVPDLSDIATIEYSLQSEIVASLEASVETQVSQVQAGGWFHQEAEVKGERFPTEGDASVPTPRPHHPRPYAADHSFLAPPDAWWNPGGLVEEEKQAGQEVVGQTQVEQLAGRTQANRLVVEQTQIGRPQTGLYMDGVARPVYLPHSTLLVDVMRKRRRRKILLRRFSRKQLQMARAVERRARRRVWITMASTVLAFLVVFLSLGSAAYVTYRFVNGTQRTFEYKLITLHDLLPADNLKMYDSKGVLIDQLIDNGIHTTVTFDQVAPIMREATVAAEDKNFWNNQGIDVLGIIRAFLSNLENGRVVEGGSTITQQLIKNLIVGNQSTIVRKLEEIILAPQVNNNYTKSDILTMYLNSIYYGHQAYGVDAAASVYFGLQDLPGRYAASQLDLAQAAMLAGIPSNPSQFDPLVHFQAATDRFETVLNLMASQGYISTVDKYKAIREEQASNFFKTATNLQNRAPHFANFVLAQLQKIFNIQNRSDLSRSNMVVYTTLDIGLQDKIQKIAEQHIAELRDAHHLTNAAEVLIDFHTGAIISLLGSIDYNDASIDGQYDVTQAYRQPGSSFKPYVYVTAFEQGASPAQAIDDKATSFPVPDSKPPTFTPGNYDHKFHGHMTLRCALQNSLNVPGVKVLQHVGIDEAMQTAYQMGITSYQGTPGYSLVLGGLGIRLIDHTSAMGVFANRGVHVPYYAINKVVSGSSGMVLYQHQVNPGVRVISPQLAYMMTSVLSDNADRIPEFYDCNVLQLYSNSQQNCWNGNRGAVRPAAAKTGTTNDFRDNWTVGYTTDFVMGVWAGNDDNSSMIDVSGISGAAPIWHDSMLVAEQGHPIQDFVNPGGLVRATVTYPDGVKTRDWFLPGTVPHFAATPTPAPTTDDDDDAASPMLTAGPGNDNPSWPMPAPYCPASYSFAFPPPPDNVIPPKPGWW